MNEGLRRRCPVNTVAGTTRRSRSTRRGRTIPPSVIATRWRPAPPMPVCCLSRLHASRDRLGVDHLRWVCRHDSSRRGGRVKTPDESQRGATFLQLCASQNDLFALDECGDVYQYNFNTKTWLKLSARPRPAAVDLRLDPVG